MDSELFYSTTSPQDFVGKSSKSFEPPSISSMQLYGNDLFTSDCQDFLGWSMDGETTTDRASDDPNSGPSSSDDDSERQAPWVRRSQPWKKTIHADSKASRGQSQHEESPISTPPLRAEASDTTAAYSSPREELPEEGLVDIDPEEGKRRGSELMAMLMTSEHSQEVPEKSESVPSAEPSPSVAAPRSLRELLSCRPCSQSASTSQWAPSWESGWESMTSGTYSSSVDSSRHLVAIQHAAQDAFGALLKDVEMDANGVYIVKLQSGMRQYDDVPMLSILSRSLWPLLGREVITLGTTMDADGKQRLAVRSRDGEIDSESSCWEFATTGVCPRGSRCRWEHASLVVHHSYVEVVY